jgi:sugar transferase (PEP-CTERM/EpsH1 system associated)
MEPLLFLCHRIPYPPNKGDKIHSYHTLRHLARRYRILLGTFIDDPADEAHAATVRGWCADAHFVRISPLARRVASLRGLLSGEPLSITYYRDPGLRKWIDTSIRSFGVRKCFGYSSAMAQYLVDREGQRVVLDIGDVDSLKWDQYAEERRWPMSWIYAREGRRLLAFERRIVRASDASLFHTVAEADLLLEHEPGAAHKVFGIPNGVDADFFSAAPDRQSPFGDDEEAIVFTGAMDYWPNVDAVSWFARDIMPAVRAERPRARFWIVGMNPSAPVRALAMLPFVTVTGRVDDVRPYLQHAALFVAPLRLARGIQNKVLEAMAMGCVVLASSEALTGIRAELGRDVEAATAQSEFVQKTIALLASKRAREMGQSARTRVTEEYNWEVLLEAYDRVLEAPSVEELDLPGCRPLRAAPRLALAAGGCS